MRKMMRMQLMKIKKCEEVTISFEYYEGCALVTMIWIMFIFSLFDIFMFLIINILTLPATASSSCLCLLMSLSVTDKHTNNNFKL